MRVMVDANVPFSTESAEDELAARACRNRAAFDATLEAYVGQKLVHPARRLAQGERELWFDATDCIWCVFDDPAFERCHAGDAGVREEGGAASSGAPDQLRVYWSLGDVVMPPECDAAWVARRIADEAARQLGQQGFRCSQQERTVDSQPHVGIAVRRRGIFGWGR